MQNYLIELQFNQSHSIQQALQDQISVLIYNNSKLTETLNLINNLKAHISAQKKDHISLIAQSNKSQKQILQTYMISPKQPQQQTLQLTDYLSLKIKKEFDQIIEEEPEEIITNSQSEFQSNLINKYQSTTTLSNSQSQQQNNKDQYRQKSPSLSSQQSNPPPYNQFTSSTTPLQQISNSDNNNYLKQQQQQHQNFKLFNKSHSQKIIANKLQTDHPDTPDLTYKQKPLNTQESEQEFQDLNNTYTLREPQQELSTHKDSNIFHTQDTYKSSHKSPHNHNSNNDILFQQSPTSSHHNNNNTTQQENHSFFKNSPILQKIDDQLKELKKYQKSILQQNNIQNLDPQLQQQLLYFQDNLSNLNKQYIQLQIVKCSNCLHSQADQLMNQLQQLSFQQKQFINLFNKSSHTSQNDYHEPEQDSLCKECNQQKIKTVQELNHEIQALNIQLTHYQHDLQTLQQSLVNLITDKHDPLVIDRKQFHINDFKEIFDILAQLQVKKTKQNAEDVLHYLQFKSPNSRKQPNFVTKIPPQISQKNINYTTPKKSPNKTLNKYSSETQLNRNNFHSNSSKIFQKNDFQDYNLKYQYLSAKSNEIDQDIQNSLQKRIQVLNDFKNI